MTDKAVENLDVLMPCAINDGAFSDLNVVDQLIHCLAFKLADV